MKSKVDIEAYVLGEHNEPVDIQLVTIRSSDVIRDLTRVAWESIKQKGGVENWTIVELHRQEVAGVLRKLGLTEKEK